MRRTVRWVMVFVLLASWVHSEEVFREIRARKFQYTPGVVKVAVGDTVTLRLISEDVSHGLFVDGYEVVTSAHPGQDGSVSFVADRRGRFTFRCSVTCGEFHPFMVGYLVVGPNMRFWLFAGLVTAIGLASIVAMLVRKRG